MNFELTITPIDEPDSLEQEWRQLEKRAASNFMLSWTWIGPWLKAVDCPRYLVRGVQAGETVLLVILSANQEVRSKGLIKSKQLIFHRTKDAISDSMTPEYNGVLVDIAVAEEAIEALGNFIQTDPEIEATFGPWEELLMLYASPKAAKEISFKGLTRTKLQQHPTFGVDLDAIRAKGLSYIEILSKNTRSQIRKSQRLYQEWGELSLKRASSLDEALSWWHEAGDLHRARWADHDGSNYDLPVFVDFHEALIKEAWPRGEVELVNVTAGDTHIGTLYNFILGGEVLFYLSALTFEDNPKLKPGLVTHAMCIQSHVDTGKSLYNFLAGYNRYKASLGTELPPLISLRFSKPKLKFKLEALAKKLLHIE